MIRRVAVGVGGRVGGHAGHGAAEDPELGDAIGRGRSALEPVDDQLRQRVVDVVHEERPVDRDRLVVRVLRREHLGVGHRPQEVGDRLGERAERREHRARLPRRRRRRSSAP